MTRTANWLTTLITGVAAAVTMLAPASRADGNTPSLRPAEAHAKAVSGEIVLVDIRTPEEWRATGVPASAHTITMHQDAGTLLAALATLAGPGKTKPLALICRTGNRSAHLTGELRRAGFTNILDVSEGVVGGRNGPGWIAAGLPLRKGSDITSPPQTANSSH